MTGKKSLPGEGRREQEVSSGRKVSPEGSGKP